MLEEREALARLTAADQEASADAPEEHRIAVRGPDHLRAFGCCLHRGLLLTFVFIRLCQFRCTRLYNGKVGIIARTCATIWARGAEVRVEGARRAAGGDAAADSRGGDRAPPDARPSADHAQRRGAPRRRPAPHALPSLPGRARAPAGVLQPLHERQPDAEPGAVARDRRSG